MFCYLIILSSSFAFTPQIRRIPNAPLFSLKLPVLQILEHGELASEFISSEKDSDSLISKFYFILRMKLKSETESLSSKSQKVGERSLLQFDNVYSDQQLEALLQGESTIYTVLKLYRHSCRKCIEVDHQLQVLQCSINDEFQSPNPNWQFIQADIDNIPNYANKLSTRLLKGENTPAMQSSIEYCNECQNTGLIPCK